MSDTDNSSLAVVIPVHRATFLDDCLASVLAQTRPPDEIIVVDDGSPDQEEIARAIRRAGDRITLIRQPNAGPGAARNRGILAAGADLVAFLDADDTWTETFLEHQVRSLRDDPRLTLVYANARVIGSGPLSGRLLMESAPSEGDVTVEALLGQRCTVITSSVVVRRTALIAAGLFDETLRRGQDFDLWVRLAAGGARVGYTKTPLVSRRVHAHNLSGARSTELERAVSVLRGLARKLSLKERERRALDAQVRLLEGQLHAERGKSRLAAGDVKAAAAEFRKAADRAGWTGRAEWKARAVSLGLRLVPGLTRRAWLFRRRRRPAGAAAESPAGR